MPWPWARPSPGAGRPGPSRANRRGRGTAEPAPLPDSLGRVCAYRISMLEIPLGINYAFPARCYSDVKITYLQLGELKAVAGGLWMRAVPLPLSGLLLEMESRAVAVKPCHFNAVRAWVWGMLLFPCSVG